MLLGCTFVFGLHTKKTKKKPLKPKKKTFKFFFKNPFLKNLTFSNPLFEQYRTEHRDRTDLNLRPSSHIVFFVEM